MKRTILLTAFIFFILFLTQAQNAAEKPADKTAKMTKHEQEVIDADGYAYAEATCRYEYAFLKSTSNPDDAQLKGESEFFRNLRDEVYEQNFEKYRPIELNIKYMEAYSVAYKKLNICIRAQKLIEQKNLENSLKK